MSQDLRMQEYDKLMGDGYAKGVPGDNWIMRTRYRTPASIGKFADSSDGQFDSKTCVAHYNNMGRPAIKNYLTFCQLAHKNYKPKELDTIIIPPLDPIVHDMPFVVELEDAEDLSL